MEKEKKDLSKKVSEVGMETFQDIVMENLMDYMPDQYQNMKFEKANVNKVNVAKIGLQLVPSASETGVRICPVFYVDEIYDFYKETEATIDTVLNYIANQYVNAMDEAPISVENLILNYDEDFIKEHVICELVNAAANEKLLEDLPHRIFHGLAVIYVVLLDDSGKTTIKVSNPMVERFNLSEEQLYSCALANIRRLADVRSLSDAINEMMGGGIINPSDGEPMLYLICNSIRLFGASTILIEEKLYELAEELGSDLYLIPSSIHEMLAISSEETSPDFLASMIMMTNTTQVEPEERLSNSVYQYRRDTREVSIALEVPDGIVETEMN